MYQHLSSVTINSLAHSRVKIAHRSAPISALPTLYVPTNKQLGIPIVSLRALDSHESSSTSATVSLARVSLYVRNVRSPSGFGETSSRREQKRAAISPGACSADLLYDRSLSGPGWERVRGNKVGEVERRVCVWVLSETGESHGMGERSWFRWEDRESVLERWLGLTLHAVLDFVR